MRWEERDLSVEWNVWRLSEDGCGVARYLSVRLLVGGLSFLSLLLVV